MAPLIVAVQGELGSNSELAALEYFDGRTIDILPCYTFADLFAAVDQGHAQAAMAPVENSLAGSIHDVWNLLLDHHPRVAGEIRLRVVHCLIGLPGATLADVRRVRSHPQALAQCDEYLTALSGVTVEAAYDTAGAVQIIKSENQPQEAAIASAQAAADHGMQILARELSAADNFTRFLVLGEGVTSVGSLKSTVILEMEHTAAALPAVLGRLAARGIEVLKVETCKRIGRPWAYNVYLEFVGGTDGPAGQALAEIGEFVTRRQIVGTYATGVAAEPRLHRR
ncbi:MAG: bifunctional chorismate mutase/prephenate dehydratase [bacterium]|nr:bifunctional chorismate mutase/prephenate dehydratase [bacterium]